MIGNRQIQIGLVKPGKSETAPGEVPLYNPAELVGVADVAIETACKHITKTVIAYMAADTVRKILITRLTR